MRRTLLASSKPQKNLNAPSSVRCVEVRSGVDFGLGATLGFDVNLGKSRWSLNSGFKYIAVSSNGSNSRDGVGFDPLIFNFGFGFRF
jgi:outer membrane protein W